MAWASQSSSGALGSLSASRTLNDLLMHWVVFMQSLLQPSLSAPECSSSQVFLCVHSCKNLVCALLWKHSTCDNVYWLFGFWKGMKRNMFQCWNIVIAVLLPSGSASSMVWGWSEEALGSSSPSFCSRAPFLSSGHKEDWLQCWGTGCVERAPWKKKLNICLKTCK